MSAFQYFFKLSMLLSLLPNSVMPNSQKSPGFPPFICSDVECPIYFVIEIGEGFEIRVYDAIVWMSTSPFTDISFNSAATTGFFVQIDYIEGKNEYKKIMNRTSPIIIQASQTESSDNPILFPSFVVSFNLPKENAADPPPAEGLNVTKWESPTYVAVRGFHTSTGEPLTDSEVFKEAEALNASLASSTTWSPFNSSFWLAQYDYSSPSREIWMMLNETKIVGHGSL